MDEPLAPEEIRYSPRPPRPQKSTVSPSKKRLSNLIKGTKAMKIDSYPDSPPKKILKKKNVPAKLGFTSKTYKSPVLSKYSNRKGKADSPTINHIKPVNSLKRISVKNTLDFMNSSM
jgi:hypothetical protein